LSLIINLLIPGIIVNNLLQLFFDLR